MKFRVVSGDLNVIVKRNMLLEDWTSEILIGIVKEALEKCEKENLELSELLRICECPLTSPLNCYYIATKSVLIQAGQKVIEK